MICLFLLFLLLWCPSPTLAEFRCAGSQGTALNTGVAAKLARTAQAGTTGTRRALVLFARFKGESATLPSWAADIFNPDLPGSFSHFYDTMSFGKLQVRGEVAPRVYESSQPASAYLAANPSEQGRFGRFSQEILGQADRDLDFARFDDDGPDGIPNSGDDDGVVDAVFLVLERIPAGFLRSEATGISDLGFAEPLATDDEGVGGQAIRILTGQGTVEQGRFFAEAVGAMCHEYGHVLGLPDLYNTQFLDKKGAGPEEDNAGVGAWCLMGWGASGWKGDDGPNSFCAWSRMQLDWASPTEIANPRERMQLSEVGKGGAVYRIPVGEREDLLLEYRTRTGCYYDRHLPGEGVLIWHRSPNQLDLVCADGRWQDAGYPQGEAPDPLTGGDNLDFWAHDEPYRQAHAGNTGDGTDPFDGTRFRAFTPGTNPSSQLREDSHPVRIEGLRLDAGLALAQVQVEPPRLEVASVRLVDEDDNGIFTSGEAVDVLIRLANRGGLRTGELRAVLSTQDSLVQILSSEVRFDPLGPNGFSEPSRDRTGFPRLRLAPGVGGNHRIGLTLEVFDNTSLTERRQIELDLVSPVLWVGRIEDEAGQGMADINIYVNAAENSRESHSGYTDREGRFRFDLQPGLYYVSLTSVPHRPVPAQNFIIALADRTYSTLVLPTAFPVSGVIRDLQGQPLSTFLSATQEDSPNWGLTNSAADGTYTLMLARGLYNLLVMSPPPLPRRLLEGVRIDGPQALDLTLAGGVRLSTSVVDEAGKGINGAQVALRGSRSGLTAALQTTDPQGNAALDPLPGLYTLLVTQLPAPYLSPLRPLAVAADTAIQIVARRGVEISGQVEDDSAPSFSNASLVFLPLGAYQPIQAPVAADGTYTARLPEGPCQVVFAGQEVARSRFQRLGVLSVDGAGAVDFAVARGEKVAGRALDARGAGLRGLEVQALDIAGDESASARTQPDGHFELHLRPGHYNLMAAERHQRFWALGTVEVPAPDSLTLQRPAGAQMQGRVVDAQGQPIAGALVVLSQSSPPLPLVYLTEPYAIARLHSSEGLVAAALSDVRGAYQLRAGPGQYELMVLPAHGKGPGMVLGKMALEGDHQRELALPADPETYQVYGLIADEPGMPCDELLLQWVGEGTGRIAQVTDHGLRNYALDLPAGRYQVRAARVSPVGGFQQLYKVGSVSIDRDSRWDIALADAATAVALDQTAIPPSFTLDPNYPNPFNPTTTLRFSLSQAGEAELTIYNLLGQPVITLLRGAQQAGTHTLTWDGRDAQGRELASGVYFYRLQAGSWVQTRKLLRCR